MRLRNKIMVVLSLLVMAGSISVLITPKVVEAAPAIFYLSSAEAASGQNCTSGDILLQQPYQAPDGTRYFCVRLDDDSVTLAEADRNGSMRFCPDGQPMFTNAFGVWCITAYPGGTPQVGNAQGTPRPTESVPNRTDLEADCYAETGALNQENCGIVRYLITFINVLSGLAAVVVVGSIILGGIQYAASADDPQKVSAAKKRIFNALAALAGFIFLYAFLQWVVPGGVF